MLFLTPDWLLHNGIGQNITAGVLVGLVGYGWSKTKWWPLKHVHDRIDALHLLHRQRHDEHTEHIERLGQSLIDLHEKVDALATAAKPTPRRAPAKRPPAQ